MSDNSNNIGTGRQGQVNDLIKIGRHGAEALLPNPKDEEKILSQFHIEEKGISLTREDKIKKIKNLYSYFLDIDPDEVRIPDKIGFEISNDSQRKILFCVLGLLTETDYQGNYQKPVSNKDKEELRLGSSAPTLGGPYKNIRQTPVLRIEKNELMQKSGFDPSKKSDRRDFGLALNALGNDRCFLIWKRFKRDENGRRQVVGQKFYKDKNGRTRTKGGKTEYELASKIGTILDITPLIVPDNPKRVFFEIEVHPVFLDEISPEYGGERGYFILVPKDALEQIEQAYRRRTQIKSGPVPPVIQNLLFWFRLRVQEIQTKNKNPFTRYQRGSKFRIKYLSLCEYLAIPVDSARKNKSRHQQNLSLGIEIGKELGYLKDGGQTIQDGDEYFFELNLEFYPGGNSEGEMYDS